MGEFDLIAALRERIGKPSGRLLLGIGDDAAVSAPGGVTATSVDAIIDGVHFRRETAPPEAIGRKALASALSDLAAMGATPGEAYLVLGVPPDLDQEGCLQLLSGSEDVAARTATALAGGDVTRSPVLFVATTVVGHAAELSELVTRSGARGDESLVLTGELGGAAAGLRLLEGAAAEELSEAGAEALRRRQLDPQPRLAEGIALAASGATAMIDVSDGLGADAGHMAEESGVALQIDLDALPLAAGVRELASATGEDPLLLAAGEGEDYELLACLPEESVDSARAAVEEAGGTLTVIGRSIPGEGVTLRSASGRELPAWGYDQLS